MLNVIPGSLPRYESLATDLTRWSYSKILWTNLHIRFQQYASSYTLEPSNYRYQHVIKSLKPVRKVKENLRHSDASYLDSGSCRCITASVNGMFTDASLSDNWLFKPPVTSIPYQFSGLVKIFRTDSEFPPNPQDNMCWNDVTTLAPVTP